MNTALEFLYAIKWVNRICRGTYDVMREIDVFQLRQHVQVINALDPVVG